MTHRDPNALVRVVYWREEPRWPVVRAHSKTGYAAARRRMVVHRVEAMCAIRVGSKLRYAARWLCGPGSLDVVPVADQNAHGGVCERCIEISRGPAVYRCFDTSGQLLYVGSTGNGVSIRLAAHEKNAAWWSLVADIKVEHLPTLEEARVVETIAIRTENPVHNVRGRPRSLASLPSERVA